MGSKSESGEFNPSDPLSKSNPAYMDVKRGPSEQKWTDEYKPSNFDVCEEYSKSHIGCSGAGSDLKLV